MSQVFAALSRTKPAGNIVFSPHAATLALVRLAEDSEGQQRDDLTRLLGLRGTLQSLRDEIDRAERRLKGPPVEEFPEFQSKGDRHFDYESFVFEQTGESSPAGQAGVPQEPRHAFVQKARESIARSGRPPLLSIVDAQVAGVPFEARPPRPEVGVFADRETAFLHLKEGPAFACSDSFETASWPAEHLFGNTLPVVRPSGRVYVTFARPKAPENTAVSEIPSLPCGGGVLSAEGSSIELDFRVPAFCATSTLALEKLLPAIEPATVALPARLALDANGTFNHPAGPLPSPQVLDVYREREPRALELDDPFFVTLHDRESGAILYVAHIREPGSFTECQ